MAQDVKNQNSRRSFDASFRLQVVQMIKVQGMSLWQVCKDMGIVESVVRRWLSQFEAEQAGLSGIGKPVNAELDFTRFCRQISTSSLKLLQRQRAQLV